jgi:molecular chaperone DnaK
LLTLSEPKLSYAEFNDAMKAFLKSTSLVPYRTKNVVDEFATIFSPIQTALKESIIDKRRN